MSNMEVGNIHIGLYVDVGDTARFTDVASMVERSSRRMNTALGDTTNSVRSLRGQMSQSLRFKLAADSLRDITKATDEVGRLRAAILGISALSGAGITGAFTAAYLVQTADKAKLLSNQLRTVTTDFANMGAVESQLFDISQRTRSSLDATTRLYARTARAAEAFGMSQANLLTITETVQKAFSIGGATPQEAASAALQLSQGIASNRFGGDEYKSVAENAPVLLDAIAKSMNVDIGTLRKMSEEGKLTAKAVTQAILSSAKQIEAAYAVMTPTVAQAFTMLDNAFLRYIGNTDNAYGITDKLAGALMGLANNFEEIAGWITTATAALATFYAANKLQQAGRGSIAGISNTNKQIREAISVLVDERDAIQKAIDDNAKEVARREFQAPSAAFDPAVLAQQDAVNKAKEAEYKSQQRLNELEKARGALVSHLGMAQNASAVRAQQEVEKARERVRLDQQRVIEAQQAAIAEERILQARREQALIKAGGRVSVAADNATIAGSRVKEAEAVIAKERELAKAKLAGEIDSRQQNLVTSAQRLRSIQSEISELRSIKDLQGFDQAYGGQYRKLLEQQQKVIASTKTTRDQISELQGKIASIDAGEGATKGITSAMNRHAAAVKQAESAVQALAKAEADRSKIAATDVGSKTLTARLANEQKALKQYESSVAMLQQKMATLKTATTDALGAGPAKKLVAEIQKIDAQIVTTQQSIRSAADAVTQAQSGSSAAIAASMKAQAKAQEELNALQKRAELLSNNHAVAVDKIAQAQKRLNLLRRAGSNVLDFFGGGTGLAITAVLTAATAAVGYFAAEGAKAAQKSADLREEMHKLGLISEETAGKVDATTEALDKLTDDKRRQKIKSIRDEIERLKGSTGFWEGLFYGDEVGTLGDLSDELDGIINSFGRSKNRSEVPIAKELKDLITQAQSGQAPIEELVKKLDEIAKKPLSDGMNELVVRARALLDTLKGSAAYMERINAGGTAQPSGREMLDRYANTRTTSANNRSFYDTSVANFEGRVLSESARTEYEGQVRGIMDRLIKDAERLGNVLLDTDARRIAEAEYANQVSKKGLLDLIGLYEGTDKGRGYNETLDYGRWTGGDVNLTQMTLREVLALQKQMLANPENRAKYGDGKGSSAVGRYQIVSTTLSGLMKNLGLSGDELFDQSMQDRLAQELIRETRGDPNALRSTWEGFKNAPDSVLQAGATGTFQSLPAYDENTKKWLDGMKDLDLQKQISSLQLFNQEVVQQAIGFGATKEEVQQYIAAVSSGDLDAVPEKFRKIAEALQMSDGAFARQMDELRQANVEGLLSEVDQEVVQTARAWGIADESVRAYVAAVRSGDLSNLPPQLAEIREELTKAASIEFDKDLLRGGIDDIISALDDGKLSWEELGEVAANVLQKIGNKILDLSIDSLFASTGSSGLLGGLMSIFGGGSSSVFPAAPGSGLWSDGGYTGDGGKNEAAGTVHKGEFVLTKKATSRAGVANLYALMRLLESGASKPSTMSEPDKGYANGGFVSSAPTPSLPKLETGGLSSMAESMSQSAPAGQSIVYAPVYHYTGTSEEIAKLKAQTARDRAEFESRTVAVIRKANNGNVKLR
jgi:tape measure domain-containing protein